MIEGIDGPPLSLNGINALRFPGLEGMGFVGPPAPISDPRLVAGLLFQRWNDGTTRFVTNRPREWPRITIRAHHFIYSDSDYFHVRREAVETLLREQILCGTPRIGYTDMEELRLSEYGQKIVVTEWFTDDTSMMDFFAAGASMTLETAEVRWRV